jgi:hydrogenase maturation protease
MDKPNGCSVGVIGIGNLLLKDEGVGVHALQALAVQLPAHDVKLVDGGTDPWAALSAVGGCSTLLVLDAVTGGKAPGEFHCLSLDEVETRNASMSLHGLSLFHLLCYERILGNGFDDVRVLGMEPAAIEPGVGLSDICRAKLPDFVEMVKSEIRRVDPGRTLP